MMKGLLLIGMSFIVAGCVTTTEVIQYRQVTVAPVVEPVLLDVESPEPIDVTTTTIDYY